MTQQASIVTLNCKNCGASLNITSDMDSFACGFCGTQQVVERRGGTLFLKLITDAITRVQAGTDKAGAELALQRLEKDLQQINRQLADNYTDCYVARENISGETTIIVVTTVGAIALSVGFLFLMAYGSSGWSLFVLAIGILLFFASRSASRRRSTFAAQLGSLESDNQAIKNHKGKIEETITKNKAIVSS